MKEPKQTQQKRQITVTLHGDGAKKFLEFKKRENLMADSEAARKLLLDRLQEIERAA